MTNYRAVTRHVRYWRGAVHRWSNVYQFTGTLAGGSYATVIAALHTMEQGICYHKSAVVSGGLYEIALYDHSSGGVPVAVTTYFPYATPGSWIPYTSSNWSATTFPEAAGAEPALQVEWAAGLSVSGKPVLYKKWYHAIPDQSPAPGAVDVPSTDAANIKSAIDAQMAVIGGTGILLGSGSRLAATGCTVRPYYGAHQMPRGRRRKALVSSSGKVSFPASVLVVPGSDGSLS